MDKKADNKKEVFKPGKDWRKGAMPVSALLPRILGPSIARNGYISAEMIAAWPQIVGATLAKCTQPEKIKWPNGQRGQLQQTSPHQRYNNHSRNSGGTLVVRVDGPRALYVQHEEAQILERANQFFGFAALSRLQIAQGALQERAKKQAKPQLAKLSSNQEAGLKDCIDGFDDPELKEAIVSLGRGILRRKLAKS